MRRLVTIDLPRRLADRVPGIVTEVAVGLGSSGLFVAARILLTPFPDRSAPFSLGFLAVVLSTLIAGWRSGLVALVVGQTLIWYFVLPEYHSFRINDAAVGYGLLLTTVTQAVMVFALGLYQREVRRGDLERQRRINFLAHALREIDHRTKNNFQIVTSLLLLQANRSGNKEVHAALKEAAERLQAVAGVYAALTPGSEGLAAVRLQDHLEALCDQIRRGMLAEGVTLETDLEPMVVPHDTAVSLGIVVNELVTNACKHAFPGGRGAIRITARQEGERARVEVSDDGCGLAEERPPPGVGTKVVAAFVKRLKGRSELRSSPKGTVHTVLVPLR
ncbi:MAG: DUF4118 domain-containing protein [Alphaproteobacteria bacterium]|nr:DUF4118 domain-containing protein [Alphaproteobacteria bacterium]MBV9371831.1 DUF4118 domain-containing protein [Alphaproteobacteria bacterium]MBV9900547.1 DUF4118 domain-containing protein [Alphaproteobacteria bacterium]